MKNQSLNTNESWQLGKPKVIELSKLSSITELELRQQATTSFLQWDEVTNRYVTMEGLKKKGSCHSCGKKVRGIICAECRNWDKTFLVKYNCTRCQNVATTLLADMMKKVKTAKKFYCTMKCHLDSEKEKHQANRKCKVCEGPAEPKKLICSGCKKVGMHSTARKKTQVGVCLNCQKIFPKKPRQKSCSEKCKNQIQAKNMMGTNNPNHLKTTRKEDKESAHFFSVLSKRIRKQIKSCCICESKENIHVHHIDWNYKNNEMSNLAVLCATCHIAHHKTSDLELIERQKLYFRSQSAEKLMSMT